MAVQVILTEEEYTDLKELADKTENYQSLYNELMSQHLALKNDYSKLLVFGLVASNERLKSAITKTYLNKGFQNNVN
jgi:hypothetical protein